MSILGEIICQENSPRPLTNTSCPVYDVRINVRKYVFIEYIFIWTWR